MIRLAIVAAVLLALGGCASIEHGLTCAATFTINDTCHR